MSDDLEFIVIDDIPEYIFCIGDDEENEQVIAIRGKDGAFKYEKVAELPTTGEDGVLYLVPKSHTTQTASGNPISVNITDNAGKIESLKLDGNTTQQTYTGKNLLPYPYQGDKNQAGITFTENADRSISINGKNNGTSNSAYYLYRNANNPLVLPAGTYYFIPPSVAGDITITLWTGSAYIDFESGNNYSKTFSSETSFRNIYIQVRKTDQTQYDNVVIYPMLTTQASPTVADYEPYVGGVPSPSPSYPQDINVVTGTQTVSINGTDYPIDLGVIELCKLGTYKDYIYKDGSDWKVHKATATITLDGSSDEHWEKSNNVFFEYSGYSYVGDVGVGSTALSPSFIYWPNTGGISNNMPNLEFGLPATKVGIGIRNDSIADADALRTWLSTNVFKAYVSLATATDTTITDTDLIAQLEAIRTAALSTGSNTISNTATGTNLAGDLEIGYYGYDPLNKYDKYFWLDIDGGYESL